MRTVKITTPNDSEPKNFLLRGDETVRDLVEDLGYNSSGVTVYHNGAPASTAGMDHELGDGDSVELSLVKSKSGNA